MIELETMRQNLLETNSRNSKKQARSRVIEARSFKESALLMLHYRFTPQSYGAVLESWVKRHLGLGDKIDNLSGDASFGSETLEIKVSIENGSEGQYNFVQIRPHHRVTHYIFVTYSVSRDEEFWFKIPSADLYDLLPEFGGYAHGTLSSQGQITNKSIKENQFEYALRPSMFSGKNTKTNKLWNVLLKYRVKPQELRL